MLRQLLLASTAVLLGLPAQQAVAGATGADLYEIRTFFNNDANEETGCESPAHDDNFDGPIKGIEYRVFATLERDPTSARITDVSVFKCISGMTFGPGTSTDFEDWAAGLEIGTDGADVVEYRVPRAAVGNPDAPQISFHVFRSGSTDNDVLITKNGQLDGESIILRLSGSSVPALSPIALAATILLLAAIAVVSLRRRPLANAGRAALVVALVSVTLTIAWAITIVPDGQIGDWAGIPAIAKDLINDSSADDPAEDIVAAFATADAQYVYFRLDQVNLAPVECGNGIKEAGEQCEDVSDCEETDDESLESSRGGAASDPCSCDACQCTGVCEP